MKIRSIVPVLLLLWGVTQACKPSSDYPLGSDANPIKFYFTPSSDAQEIAKSSDELMEYLERETGYFFETGIPSSYIAVVEAFGSDKVDIAIMNSFGYLLANQKYGAVPKLRVVRYGKDTYGGQIIAHRDENIESLQDLNGKTFAFTDPSSTSGYLFPLKMLKEAGVELQNEVFATKHDMVVTMVYQNQVAAGATFHSAPSADGEIRDARARVKTQFPDVEQVVKIVALTDPIPNDPVVFRKDLPEEITTKVIAALKKFIKTAEGKKLFEEFYAIQDFVDAQDQDYDVLREMIKATGIEASDILKEEK